MSFLLPHFLKENRGKLDVYFTRVYNPRLDQSRRLLVDGDADRSRRRSGCTSR